MGRGSSVNTEGASVGSVDTKSKIIIGRQKIVVLNQRKTSVGLLEFKTKLNISYTFYLTKG